MTPDIDTFEQALIARRRRRVGFLVGIGVACAAAGTYVLVGHILDRRAEEARHEAARAESARLMAPTPVEDPSARRRLADDIARARAVAAEREARFQAALTAGAVAADEPCPVEAVSVRTSTTRDEASWGPLFPVVEIDAQSAGAHPSRLWEAAQRDLAEAQTALDQGNRPDKLPTINDLDDGNRYEIVIRVTRRVQPQLIGPRFTPGQIAGQVILWDHQEARIACIGDVEATSSESVSTMVIGDLPSDVVTGNPYARHNRESKAGALEVDLWDEMFRAIAGSLRVADPDR